MNEEFKIVDAPLSRIQRSKWARIAVALRALPKGKGLFVKGKSVGSVAHYALPRHGLVATVCATTVDGVKGAILTVKRDLRAKPAPDQPGKE
jgi:hypothetical protein